MPMHSSSRLRYDPTGRTLPISHHLAHPRVQGCQGATGSSKQRTTGDCGCQCLHFFLWIGSLGGRPGKTVVCLCGMMQVHCDYSLVATKSLLCNIVYKI